MGIRNTGGRPLYGLVVKSLENGSTEVAFRKFRGPRGYSSQLVLGNLDQGEKVMFWVREKFVFSGPASVIRVEEA